MEQKVRRKTGETSGPNKKMILSLKWQCSEGYPETARNWQAPKQLCTLHIHMPHQCRPSYTGKETSVDEVKMLMRKRIHLELLPHHFEGQTQWCWIKRLSLE